MLRLDAVDGAALDLPPDRCRTHPLTYASAAARSSRIAAALQCVPVAGRKRHSPKVAPASQYIRRNIGARRACCRQNRCRRFSRPSRTGRLCRSTLPTMDRSRMPGRHCRGFRPRDAAIPRPDRDQSRSEPRHKSNAPARAGALRCIGPDRSDRRPCRMPAALRRHARQHYGVRVAFSVTPENEEYARTLT